MSQNLINERLVNKLEEIFRAHNELVLAVSSLLAQVNTLALKIQELEEKKNA